jgi:F-type H+-transporting ATPase subunit epsilon
MNKLKFQLVTPERTVLHEELDSLSCPTTLGQITILPGHIPLVATLTVGELIARTGGKEENIAVSGGFIEVRSNNEVVALADAADHHYEIDVQKTEEAIKRAQTAMKETKMSAEEYARVAASLNQSLTRLNIARKHSHRRGEPITGQGTLDE